MNRWGPVAVAVLGIALALYTLFGAELGTNALAFLLLTGAAALASFYLVQIPSQRRRQRALLKLAQLRTSGVELRNRGSAPMSKQARPTWSRQVDDWERQVLETAQLLSATEAESLRTLDTFPLQRIRGVTDPRVVHKVSMLSATLKRLDALIQRHLAAD